MKRSPAAAFWLSLLPGVGHFYLGQFKKGLIFAVLVAGAIQLASEVSGAFFGIMIPVLWLFAMLDAHQSAQAINMGMESGGEVALFGSGGSKWWGGSLIGLGVLLLSKTTGLFDLDWLWQFWPVVLIVVGIRLIKPGPVAKPLYNPPPAPPVEEGSTADRAAAADSEPVQDKGEENERTDAV